MILHSWNKEISFLYGWTIINQLLRHLSRSCKIRLLWQVKSNICPILSWEVYFFQMVQKILYNRMRKQNLQSWKDDVDGRWKVHFDLSFTLVPLGFSSENWSGYLRGRTLIYLLSVYKNIISISLNHQ